MLALSRTLARRLFSTAAAPEGAAAASTSLARKAQNPLEEFFEVERSTQDDQPAPHYGTSLPPARPQLTFPSPASIASIWQLPGALPST
mgnify:CR=1 FL=1